MNLLKEIEIKTFENKEVSSLKYQKINPNNLIQILDRNIELKSGYSSFTVTKKVIEDYNSEYMYKVKNMKIVK